MNRTIFGSKSSYKHKVAVCCIAKHEDPYFAEWIDYHLQIGVTHFYIYDNESKIPVSASLSKYIEKGIVTVERITGKQMQIPSYKHCLMHHGPECQWIAFIDVDEFIVPKTLTGNLPAFLEDYKKYGGLGIYWLMFGSNGNLEKPHGTQLESYTKRSLKTEGINGHIKSIVQPRYVKSVEGPHHFNYKSRKHCVNENFECIEGPISIHTSNKIQLNHYFLRSLAEFKLKIARGRADILQDRSLDEFYSTDERCNFITDESIKELKILMNKNGHP